MSIQCVQLARGVAAAYTKLLGPLYDPSVPSYRSTTASQPDRYHGVGVERHAVVIAARLGLVSEIASFGSDRPLVCDHRSGLLPRPIYVLTPTIALGGFRRPLEASLMRLRLARDTSGPIHSGCCYQLAALRRVRCYRQRFFATAVPSHSVRPSRALRVPRSRASTRPCLFCRVRSAAVQDARCHQLLAAGALLGLTARQTRQVGPRHSAPNTPMSRCGVCCWRGSTAAITHPQRGSVRRNLVG